MAVVSGPSFAAVQVRETAAATLCETPLRLRATGWAAERRVCLTAFALRQPGPGLRIAGHCPEPAQAGPWAYMRMRPRPCTTFAAAGVTIVAEPADEMFDSQDSQADTDGYAVTVHNYAS